MITEFSINKSTTRRLLCCLAALLLLSAVPNHAQTVSTLAGTIPFADGAGVTAQFNNPTGVAVDGAGNVSAAVGSRFGRLRRFGRSLLASRRRESTRC